MRIHLKLLAGALVVLGAGTAYAAEPERVVVRNRLYNPEGQFELGLEAGTSLVNRMVQHNNFQATAAYNFTNELALEFFGGYALSGHTDVADQANAEIAKKAVTSTQTTDDFAGMWEMQWNVVGGIRWAPIYGKLNLVSDLPVHFQAYLGAGGGVAGLRRESVAYCTAPAVKDQNGSPLCDQPLKETRTSPVVQFGGGLRFWIGPKFILRLEARDYTFPDKYLININRQQAADQNGAQDNSAGEQQASPGFEHIVFVGAGISYIF